MAAVVRSPCRNSKDSGRSKEKQLLAEVVLVVSVSCSCAGFLLGVWSQRLSSVIFLPS